ncbi:MAG TPA: hypothetical protein VL463_17185 [Kofleriaceae bacterium]|nr:hypothetical protein [Kofleriaceae bacterium]
MRKLIVAVVVLAGCNAEIGEPFEDEDATEGASVSKPTPLLSGCHGQASSAIPSDDKYVMTTFGGGGDTQPMSCGGIADGVGWYVASRQRFGCGAHVEIRANGKCVVASADDYGPDVCVENAAHMAILDASPRVSKELFGASGLGWSDHVEVTATEVASSTPLGPCTSAPPPTPTTCASSTLGRDVADGTCVQSASDAAWYQCSAGAWNAIASTSACTTTYAWCQSATLGKAVPARTCVQSASNSAWYQCNGQGWVKPVDTSAKTGPIGACSTWNAL